MLRTCLLLFALAALATSAATSLVVADPYDQHGDCDSAGLPAAHRIELTTGTADATFYVDDENYALGNGLWIYQESNGIWVPKLPGIYLEGTTNANLQRGIDWTDCIWSLSGCEICTDDVPEYHDTLLW